MLFEKVRELIANNLKLDPSTILLSTEMIADLSVNSLDLVELVCAFEMEFGVEVPERDIRKFRKVGDIVEYLEKKLINRA
ncbi:MAG: acyl carrier protein [Eubacteriales bacterium]